jgi:hypothetical protein
MAGPSIHRRDFHRLSLAALGGMAAGAAGSAALAAAQNASKNAKNDAQKGAQKDTKAKKKEIHVCRGLNSCKTNGADGKNACAGMGDCATAVAHSCAADNACKGQGGCGATPGENACKGKGECAVPLHASAWTKARSRFEARMKKANKKFGPAPKPKQPADE